MATQEARNTEAGNPSGGTQVVLFQLAGKSFAVELGQVDQIIDYREPARTPRRPRTWKG